MASNRTVCIRVIMDSGSLLCDGVEVRFTDVGHLLGSAAIEIWIYRRRRDRENSYFLVT